MTNKDARQSAGRYLQNLPNFKVIELRILARILGAPLRRRVKGGVWKFFGKDEIVKSIRSAIGRGTFADRLARFAEKAEQFSNNNDGN